MRFFRVFGRSFAALPRVSGVTLLAAAVLVLLPALAWLQYSWLNQIADADRERRARTLQTAASQLAQDFDGEVGKAVMGLQLEPGMVEQQAWVGYAERYQAWADASITPDIVQAVYFVAVPDDRAVAPDALVLRVWRPQAQTFEAIDWPADLQAIRSRFTHDGRTMELQIAGPHRGERGPRGGDRMFDRLLLPPGPLGDERTVVVPVMRISVAAPISDIPTAPPDVKLLGFTVLRLDTAALSQEVLPALVRKHLYDDRGHSDYLVAVVARDDPSRVIFESDEGAAKITAAAPDTAVALLGPRMGQFLFMARDGRRGGRIEMRREEWRGPPPPPPPPPSPPATENVVVNVIETRKDDRGGLSVQGRGFPGGDGHWRLVAKHRAGSLEAAVAAARTRNFILSSGILALLAAAIGLIVVSARRADRLARQQLEFVAAVSHELRTPVSVIGAAAGNLADGVVDEPERVRKYGSTIQAEARRLGETVERVLQLAGIAAGRGTAAGTPMPVATLVQDAVAACRPEIEHAGATIEVMIANEIVHSASDPSGMQRVVGDATALRSAIQNLISNAVKYGGDSPWVRVTATATAHRATRITVEDRGLGISVEDRKHIFEPFYRGREAVSRQIQGSGLGLHLVHRIIEAHRGSVSVQSEPGRGSTFTIDLPGVHDRPARPEATQSSPAPAGL